MAASLSTIAGKDGNGTLISGAIQALDLSGTGAGPWSFANILVDGAAGINRLGVDSSGRLTVLSISNFQGSAAGGSAAPNSSLSGGIFNTVAPTLTTGQQAGFQLDSSGNLKVNVAVGGGTGGTSSSFGSAFPSVGTAIGGSDGTNMVSVRIKAASTAPIATDPALVVALSPNGLNPNGQAVMLSSAPFTLASDQAIISVVQDVTKLGNGGSTAANLLTPQFAKITASSSGATTIVSAVVSKKIVVLAWDVVANAAVNFKWQSHVTPTDLTGLYYMAGQGNGVARAFNPVGYFQTVAGEALDINLSASSAVGGSLVYVTV